MGFTGGGVAFRFRDAIYAEAFGMVGNGIVNDTANFKTALLAARQEKLPVVMQPGREYLIDPVVIENGINVPLWIDMNGASFVSSGQNFTEADPLDQRLIEVINPHGTHKPKFKIINGWIDGNGNCGIPLAIHGSSESTYGDLTITGGLSDALVLEGGPGHGVYSNYFPNVTCWGNGGRGLYSTTINHGGVPRNASNVFMNPNFHRNVLQGAYFDWAGGAVLGMRVERNNKEGLHVDNCNQLIVTGGYFENNDQDMALTGVSDNSQDAMAILTGNASGVQIYGPRDIGLIDDSGARGSGNRNVIVTRNANTLKIDSLGELTAGDLRTLPGGGIRMGTGVITSNTLAGEANMKLQTQGNNVITLSPTNVEGQTNAQFKMQKGGSVVVVPLKVGAPDSGSTASRRNLEIDN